MKVKKVIKNFELTYFTIYSANEHLDNIKALQLLGNVYIQFFRAEKYREFLIEFIKHYNSLFEIFDVGDSYEQKSWKIRSFVHNLAKYSDNYFLDEYMETAAMLRDIELEKDPEFVQEIVSTYDPTHNFYISFTEILKEKNYGIKSINTIKKYVKKLNIEVFDERGYQKGKFITHNDLKRILEEMVK
ncbi:hypothetical protein OKW21_006074 [Catalinimonas alkaloidigena]|uniref:hypothetical protein n=1 Tax=Catalinimonas alkaloidigena TaxID=1075417 RepID=UPI002404C0FF|nr:hypothetical protein [Catalinimonas alkaloidigena]MDF9800811.1 hypothetical protein [Catalinimonas alkaloidigena]